MRDMNSQAPSDVTLTLSETAKLTLADLQAEFGDYSNVPRMRPGQAYSVAFYVDIPQKPFTCTIFASLKPDAEVEDSSAVASLNVRRDMRLDE
jgi:hypothetical protein